MVNCINGKTKDDVISMCGKKLDQLLVVKQMNGKLLEQNSSDHRPESLKFAATHR